jgi:hypothetical protein
MIGGSRESASTHPPMKGAASLDNAECTALAAYGIASPIEDVPDDSMLPWTATDGGEERLGFQRGMVTPQSRHSFLMAVRARWITVRDRPPRRSLRVRDRLTPQPRWTVRRIQSPAFAGRPLSQDPY